MENITKYNPEHKRLLKIIQKRLHMLTILSSCVKILMLTSAVSFLASALFVSCTMHAMLLNIAIIGFVCALIGLFDLEGHGVVFNSYKSSVFNLAYTYAPVSLGPLIEALKYLKCLDQGYVASLLCRIMDGVKHQDTELLTDRQQLDLWSFVFSGWKTGLYGRQRLAISTLKVFTFVGNLEIQKRISILSRDGAFRNLHPEISEEAQKCSAEMEIRLCNENNSSTLMRASSGFHQGSGTLLQPAMSPLTEITSEELLRSYISNNNDEGGQV